MTASRTLYAAIDLPDAGGLPLKACLDAAAAAMERHDPRPDGAPLRNPRKLSVHGGTLSLGVSTQDCDAGVRLLFEVFGPASAPIGRGPAAPHDRAAVAVLADVVATVLRASDSGTVEWAAPGALIAREEFLSLQGYVSPRRTGHGARPVTNPTRPGTDGAPAPGLCARWLAHQMRASTPREARLGAAGWALTALLATVSLPVAALISIVGLTRGMDFRMTAHALVVTLLVMALMDGWPEIARATTLLN